MVKFVLRFIPAVAFWQLVVISSAYAIDTDDQGWMVLDAKGAVYDRFGLQLESETRHQFREEKIKTNFFRPSIYYKYSDFSSVSVGYEDVRNGDFDSTEHNALEQIQTQVPTSVGDAIFRFRQEQRFFKGEDETGNRSRILTRLNMPNFGTSKIFPFVTSETFYYYNGTDGRSSGLGENRSGAGLGYQVTPKVRVDVGFLYQYVANQSPKEDLGNSIVTTCLQYRW